MTSNTNKRNGFRAIDSFRITSTFCILSSDAVDVGTIAVHYGNKLISVAKQSGMTGKNYMVRVLNEDGLVDQLVRVDFGVSYDQRIVKVLESRIVQTRGERVAITDHPVVESNTSEYAQEMEHAERHGL